ncbi:MAG TPA: hypothetical protein VHV47_04155, partial [Opitutaceae bacterium]|nr:hypothetical protein [Opitutaceae bacterium]
MKKSFPLFLLGLVIGGAAVWFLARRAPEAAPAPAAAPAAGDEDKEKAVTGSDIATASPQPITLAPEVQGYGRVLDPAPLVALATDLAAAQAAADASAADLARTSSLHDQGDNASLQAVEAARAASLRDQTQLMAARARLTAGWGRGTGNRADLAALSRDLAEGNAALVRIDLPPESALASPPGTAQVSPLAGAASWHEVAVLGAAPVSDAQVQGSSYLAVWRGEPLAIGTTLRIRLSVPGQPE